MHYYGLDELPPVARFCRCSRSVEREQLLVRSTAEAVELLLELPAETMSPVGRLGLDALCQLVEGVSHFVMVAERARCELPTTQLELELQAEVDKFVVLAVARRRPLPAAAYRQLHSRLFDSVRFAHRADTARGQRYRLAHKVASRYVWWLQQEYLGRRRTGELRAALRRFYRAGPTTKLELARAA